MFVNAALKIMSHKKFVDMLMFYLLARLCRLCCNDASVLPKTEKQYRK